MFGKRGNLELECLKKGEMQNFNVWKRPKFRMKAKFRISMFGKSQNFKFWLFQTLKF